MRLFAYLGLRDASAEVQEEGFLQTLGQIPQWTQTAVMIAGDRDRSTCIEVGTGHRTVLLKLKPSTEPNNVPTVARDALKPVKGNV